MTLPTPEPTLFDAGPPLAVVAFDLSVAATGICYRDGSTATVKTRTADGDRRLLQIAEAARLAVGGHHIGLGHPPVLAVLEDIPRNSHAAKAIAMVHGVVRSVLIEAGVPYALITAATLKAYATGKGSGDKTAMVMAAYKRAGLEFSDDNCCDAWWLWCAGRDHLGIPPIELPKAQRDRLAKVCWPEVER
ncbi:Holliday junction endonuclease [Streptomyces sp. AJS327]|uniref:Holliday junction endonuclease n=1 Tax=Streptomyces sp. AJS327 TaxID=2545265 RepID=UPI0015DFC10F|nr:Holliday junction endonuclease [Streptomyces sp. AJS327]MBA0053491.1 Holliday junction endonuclease [Streptomyces sp. AJS327]